MVAVVALHSNAVFLALNFIFPFFTAFIVIIITNTRYYCFNRVSVHRIDVKGCKTAPFTRLLDYLGKGTPKYYYTYRLTVLLQYLLLFFR